MKTDTQIQTDVITELKWYAGVTHEHIGVAVLDGVVTLSGTVPTYLEKSAAEKAALGVAGVKAVVEKIEVKLPDSGHRDDQDIAEAIVDQFRCHSQVPDDLVKVSVESGRVELTGEVEWNFQRKAAAKAVKGVRGVKRIANKITTKPKAAQPDVIKHNLEGALK